MTIQLTRRSALLLTLVAVALAAVLATSGTARAATTPYHYDYGADCYTNPYFGPTIDADAPGDMRSVSGGQEAVYWRADLYRYTSAGWTAYITTKPWLQAQATGYGLIRTMFNGFVSIWSDYPSGRAGVRYVEFPSLPVGTYAVRQTFLWSNGLKSVEWQPMNGDPSDNICTVS
jgi:hypothetical protein